MSEKVITLSALSRFKSNYDTYVAGLIASAIAGVYKPKGSKTVAQLNSLTGQQVGDVYNVTDSGTLTAGSVSVVAGDNVVWVTEGSNSHWDKLAGTIDLSGYLPKSAGSGNALTGDLYTNGNVVANKIAANISLGGSITLEYGLTPNGQIRKGVILKDTMSTYGVTIYAPSVSANTAVCLPNTSGTLALTSDLSVTNIATYLGYTPYNGDANSKGFITGISSQDVINALGYTPYNSTNPSGFITGITKAMVTTALGYTPLGPSDYANDTDIDGLFA